MTTYEPAYLSRPGADDIVGAGAPAEEVSRGIWLSPGLSNSYMLTTDEGRIVMNTSVASTRSPTVTATSWLKRTGKGGGGTTNCWQRSAPRTQRSRGSTR